MGYTVHFDVPCVHCGYNLRGLPLLHTCPECGAEIVDSIDPHDDDLDREVNKANYRDVMEASGYSIDAILFVRDCVRHATWKESKAVRTPLHTTALAVCEALREYALWYFGDADEAIQLLEEWGIKRSEDVGRIVFALVTTGRIKAAPTDTIEQFDGVFLLSDWLRQPPAPQ